MKKSKSNVPVNQDSLLKPKEITLADRLMDVLRSWSVLLVGITGLFAWHFGVIFSGIQSYILPGPLDVFTGLKIQLQDSLFYSHLWVTTQESLAGFFIAVVIAMVLGTAVSQIRIVEKAFMPYIAAIQTVPKVALAPLFVIWFGYGISSKIVMAAVICFFPILINVIEGLNSADPERVRMLTAFGASKGQIFRKVKFPSALPFIFAGLDIGIIFAILGSVVGEFLGAKQGLGVLLLQTQYNFDIPGMFAVLIVLSVMGLIGHTAIVLLKRKFAFWSLAQ
jgi:NitT/TauT family transport system permease protein